MRGGTNWRRLESKVRDLFQECGCSARKAIVSGPGKVQYEIDCLVTFEALSLPTKWIVECKDWGSRIPQEVAASLRQRVTDTGADKGILVCPSGFQTGTMNQAEISSLILITPDQLEDRLWIEFKRLVTEAAFKQIRELRDRRTTYIIRLEDYLYAHETTDLLDIKRKRYERTSAILSTALVAIQCHMEQWEAGRPSVGLPANIPERSEKLERKTNFKDDREMLKHVMRLISQISERVDKEEASIADLPDSPRAPIWPPPMKGPRYFPTPPKKKTQR